MHSYRILILSHILALSLAFSVAAQEAPQYVFRIPEYPGMEPFNSYSPGLKLLNSPFATSMRVYKTKDNSPLDKDKIIAFYSDALMSKGWKKGIFERRGDEPYLNLRTQVCENLKDGTSIHIAGDFYLWLAPEDGMLTIFMRQWRISSPDQQTRQQVAKIIEALEGTDRAVTFSHDTLKVYSDSGWEEDYENEYLVRRELFMIADKAVKNTSDIDPSGRISISILTYRDTETAKGEMNRRKTRNLVSPFEITIGKSYDAIFTIGKSIVLIKDHSSEQQEKVNNIAARLQELIK